jgi:hypothetical protein
LGSHPKQPLVGELDPSDRAYPRCSGSRASGKFRVESENKIPVH